MLRPTLHLILLAVALALVACSASPQPASSLALGAGAPGVAHAAAGESPTPLPPGAGGAVQAGRTPLPTWTLPFAPTQAATPTRLRVPEALFTPTPTAVPCADTHGTITAASFDSDTLNYALDLRVYLPPCYRRSTARYPVLYLIHGLNFTEDQWERLGAPAAADQLIAAGEIAPLIIVMPRDRRDERLDLAFVRDLVPYIDTTYLTLAERRYRAIGGLSRGAGWAIHIGLHYPALFGRIGAHSPAIFYGDEINLLDWARHLPPDQVPAVYFDIGDNDSQRQSAVWFDQVLTWFKIEHTYVLREGSHSEKYWSAHVAEYLRFYAADWRAAFLPTAPPSPDE